MHRLKFLITVCACSLGLVLLVGVVSAGSLSPSASPAATSYTLTDIYTRLTTNASATAGDHDFAPAASPSGTLYTLTQIYNAIPTMSAATILTGTSYLGVSGAAYGDTNAGYVLGTATTSGTALMNLWNGTRTDGGFPGGSQADGGVDDYNNAKAPAGDRYVGPAGWTQCAAGNNYCGTGDSGADEQDNSTGLVWSLPCNGSACASFSDSSPLTYSWDSSAANNASRTASQLCSDHAGWSLPHQKQFMQAYIDGSYGNVEASGDYRLYWSATTQSNSTVSAWYVYLSNGATNVSGKTSVTYVRCVRPAL